MTLELARMRRLALPAMQVNVAQEQASIAGTVPRLQADG